MWLRVRDSALSRQIMSVVHRGVRAFLTAEHGLWVPGPGGGTALASTPASGRESNVTEQASTPPLRSARGTYLADVNEMPQSGTLEVVPPTRERIQLRLSGNGFASTK